MTLPVWITFECYGTLVDFDLSGVTRRALGSRLDRVDADAFLSRFEQTRFEEVLGEYRPYRDVLRRSLARAMREFGLGYREADGKAIIAAVPTFGPFPDVPPVLARLRRHCKLAIISNSDDDLIAGNLGKIGVPFERVITAQQARAYKPTRPFFEHTLRELGCDARDLLHVAQGFAYDIIPTHDLAWRRVWINRRHQPGDPAYGPYAELPDLTGLPGLLGMDNPS